MVSQCHTQNQTFRICYTLIWRMRCAAHKITFLRCAVDKFPISNWGNCLIGWSESGKMYGQYPSSRFISFTVVQCGVEILPLTWLFRAKNGWIFFFAKRREILITLKPDYIPSQSMTPCIEKPAYATLLNMSHVSLIARVHGRSYSALSSHLGISPPVGTLL